MSVKNKNIQPQQKFLVLVKRENKLFSMCFSVIESSNKLQ